MLPKLPSAIDTIVGGLVNTFKANKSIKDFLSDFTDATVKWVRPLFLKNDDTPQKALEALQEAPDDTTLQAKLKGIIEFKADENEALAKILQEMAKKIEEKMGKAGNITQNDATIRGDGNTNLQDVKDSTINISNTTQHHSGTGDNVAGNKIVDNNNKD